MKDNIHVIYDGGECKMKKENSEKASYTFNTKEEAIELSKKQAEKEQVELIIHNQNGNISNKNSYGNDSNPPKDEKF